MIIPVIMNKVENSETNNYNFVKKETKGQKRTKKESSN